MLPAGYYTLDDAPVYFNGESSLPTSPLRPSIAPHNHTPTSTTSNISRPKLVALLS